MRILNTSVGWITNAEMSIALRLDQARDSMRPPHRKSESAKVVRDKALAYLSHWPWAGKVAPEALGRCLKRLQILGLSEAEALDLINLRPKTEVEFHLVLEELAERGIALSELESALGDLQEAELTEADANAKFYEEATKMEAAKYARKPLQPVSPPPQSLKRRREEPEAVKEEEAQPTPVEALPETDAAVEAKGRPRKRARRHS